MTLGDTSTCSRALPLPPCEGYPLNLLLSKGFQRNSTGERDLHKPEAQARESPRLRFGLV
jgi:hypothetical protein